MSTVNASTAVEERSTHLFDEKPLDWHPSHLKARCACTPCVSCATALLASEKTKSRAHVQVAAAIFASPPMGTHAEALEHFNLAEDISPGFYIKVSTIEKRI